MMDVAVRQALSRPMEWIAAHLDRPWVTPNGLTLLGMVIGLSSAALAGFQLWIPALATWLVSRALDGLDGTLARRRLRLDPHARRSEVGGFLDIVADFIVYGATVVGIALGATAGFDAPWWPFLLVLLAYYINGTAFLAFSSIAERTGHQINDGRSLSFLGRIAEGTETIVVHSLWLVLPWFAWQIALVWSVFVFISAVQRIVSAIRILR
ncbi:CDP-alcohol phosphatidyltransferase family protein [Demequina flava]|uniref:CDP-alcohol phosphatidyltransferase family protein n=1 Tax=Demequina flava TaxID=1095025 RepID=UPI000782BA75|nr:CDP-alcohol phosphatidyltransferase family protein [Demequina flava]